MAKSFWLGLAAYLVPTFPIGYFWHLSVFAEDYHRLEIYRPEVIIPMGIAAMLIQAVVFSWSYPRLFSVERSEWGRSALKAALALGALSWSFTTLPVAAKFRMTSVADFMMLETAFTAAQFAVVAPLLALAHRKSR